MIVTDDGVPAEYTRAVAEASRTPTVLCLPQGEDSKRIPVWQSVLSKMLESGFTRSDCVVAVGGGVVGDLSGFAASAYMRGIDFYNIPTTLLSQIDSGIGGKTGVDMDGVKNCVGAFWQPRCVIIDPNVLSTLDPRQLRCGLAEAVKMAACFDSELLDEIVLNGGEDIDRIIHDSLMIKRSVVEQDERESGLRRALNFGHTLGHGIEAASGGALLHGECVALGMLPMSAGTAKEKIISALHAVGLDTMLSITPKLRGEILDAVSHDKKVGIRRHQNNHGRRAGSVRREHRDRRAARRAARPHVCRTDIIKGKFIWSSAKYRRKGGKRNEEHDRTEHLHNSLR